MFTLEQARARIKIEQDKMYELTKSPMPGLQIQISANTIQHVYAVLSVEDRSTLIKEQTDLALKVRE